MESLRRWRLCWLGALENEEEYADRTKNYWKLKERNCLNWVKGKDWLIWAGSETGWILGNWEIWKLLRKWKSTRWRLALRGKLLGEENCKIMRTGDLEARRGRKVEVMEKIVWKRKWEYWWRFTNSMGIGVGEEEDTWVPLGWNSWGGKQPVGKEIDAWYTIGARKWIVGLITSGPLALDARGSHRR